MKILNYSWFIDGFAATIRSIIQILRATQQELAQNDAFSPSLITNAYPLRIKEKPFDQKRYHYLLLSGGGMTIQGPQLIE